MFPDFLRKVKDSTKKYFVECHVIYYFIIIFVATFPGVTPVFIDIKM